MRPEPLYAAPVGTVSAIGEFDKLVAAVRYVDAFFPENEDTKIWEKENAEAIAIARRTDSATKEKK